MKMKNKVIIITGAGMGLGYAAAKELASQDANLVLVDYNEKSLADAKAEIPKEFPDVKIITVVADVSKEEAVKNYVDEAVSQMQLFWQYCVFYHKLVCY